MRASLGGTVQVSYVYIHQISQTHVILITMWKLNKESSLISHTLAISDFHAAQYKLQNFIDCKHFSSLHKRLRITAYVVTFVKKLLTKSNSYRPVTRQGRVPCS